MSARLVAIWPKPSDIHGFEQHYFDVHMAKARAMPGLTDESITHIGEVAGQDGTPHIVTMLQWENEIAMQNALSSDEGLATLADLDLVEERYGIRPEIMLGRSA